MATLSSLTSKFSTINYNLRRGLNACLSRSYSAAQEGEQTQDHNTAYSNLLEEQKRARLEELRNVSRLSPNHFKQYHGQPPDLPYKDLHRRKLLYAQFGAASGEDPRILWPTREKLLDQELEEQEEGSPLAERLAEIQARKEQEEAAKLERREKIAKNMSQMPKWIAEYKQKQKAVEDAAKARAEKKEVLLQEARERYGYRVQANDPKFQKMVEEKESQEKIEKKKRKKEEKQQRITQFQQTELTKMKPQETKE